jgi:hypothetical protein
MEATTPTRAKGEARSKLNHLRCAIDAALAFFERDPAKAVHFPPEWRLIAAALRTHVSQHLPPRPGESEPDPT